MNTPLLHSRGFVHPARSCHLFLRVAGYHTASAISERYGKSMTDPTTTTTTTNPSSSSADEGQDEYFLLTPGRFSQGKYKKFCSKVMSISPPPPSASASSTSTANHIAEGLSKLNLQIGSYPVEEAGGSIKREPFDSLDTDSDEGGVSLMVPQPVGELAQIATIVTGETTSEHSRPMSNKKGGKKGKKRKNKEAKAAVSDVRNATSEPRRSVRLAKVAGSANMAPVTGNYTTTQRYGLGMWFRIHKVPKRYCGHSSAGNRFSDRPWWHRFEIDQKAGTQPARTFAAPASTTATAKRAAPPVPTKAYLNAVQAAPCTVNPPARPLVILDLNGTLLFRNRQKASDVQKASANPELRPHLVKFLDYLFSNFQVMIWSSATPQNVQRMAAACFTKEQLSRLVTTWARDTLGLGAEDYRSKVITYKRLDQVFNQVRTPGIPAWDHTNTVLIDDSAIKAQSHPYNHIEIPDFDEDLFRRGDDSALAEVAGYLEVLRWHNSAASFIRNMPFKLGQGWTAPWLRA